MKVESNVVYKHLANSKKKITVEQGGARSGKTYNILTWFIIKLLNEERKVLSICRKTKPSIKKTVFRDFVSIMDKCGFYNEANLNKTDLTYKFGSNLIEFFSLDEPQKVRGGKRDYLFLNEVNEVDFDAWVQLRIRTVDKIVLDYNPSMENHWVYDLVKNDIDADFYKTSFLDNPYLEDSLVSEIKKLKDIDKNYWKVFGLGEKGQKLEIIYNPFLEYKEWPQESHLWFDEIIYGLDFGFNHPTAFVEIGIKDGEYYLREHIYQSGLNNSERIQLIKQIISERFRDRCIYADSANPEFIQEICNAGFNCLPADKGQDSVRAGIDLIKRSKVYTLKDNVNIEKERSGYVWKKDKEGNLSDKEPVKFRDDLMDAIRYPIYTHNVRYGNGASIKDVLNDIKNNSVDSIASQQDW